MLVGGAIMIVGTISVDYKQDRHELWGIEMILLPHISLVMVKHKHRVVYGMAPKHGIHRIKYPNK